MTPASEAVFVTSTYRKQTLQAPSGTRVWNFRFCIGYQAPVEESTPDVMAFANAKRWAIERGKQLDSHRIIVLP